MEQKRKEINGTTYLVTQMPGTAALRAQARLVSLLGKGIFEVLGKGSVKDLMKNQEKMMEALTPILENFDDEKAVTFVLSLFDKGVFIEKSTEEGKKVPIPIDFETAFVGKTMDMWKVVGFILQANFSQGK